MENNNSGQTEKNIKLIFNPRSGTGAKSPGRLAEILKELEILKLKPDIYIMKPESDLAAVTNEAAASGFGTIAVCGGDGSVSAVARELIGKSAALGIVPTGTQNNIAFSLGIPGSIPEALAMLKTGSRMSVDCGAVTCSNSTTDFFEICSVGLFSAVFPSCEAMHNGNILKIGDFFAAFASSPKAEISLLLDNGQKIRRMGHVLLIANMPFVIRHYKVGSADAFHDGLLDVLLFTGRSKMDLMELAIAGSNTDMQLCPGIRHFLVRSADIDTTPQMPVMADGRNLGEGHIHVEVKKNALSIIASGSGKADKNRSGEEIEK